MQHPFLAHTRPHHDAADLLALFGVAAPDEAEQRAVRARAIGNHLHFCRWRQVGRLLAVLDAGAGAATMH